MSSTQPKLKDFLISETSNTWLGFFLQNQIKMHSRHFQKKKTKTAAYLFFCRVKTRSLSCWCNVKYLQLCKRFLLHTSFCFVVFYLWSYSLLPWKGTEFHNYAHILRSMFSREVHYQLLCLGLLCQRILGEKWLKMNTVLDSFGNTTEAWKMLGKRGLPSCAWLSWTTTKCPLVSCCIPASIRIMEERIRKAHMRKTHWWI